MGKEKINDDLEVLVDVPITDFEKFIHLTTGEKPIDRPVRMTYGTYRRIKTQWRVFFASLIATMAIGLYSSAIQEHGSSSKAYDSFMQQVDKWPSRMYNP